MTITVRFVALGAIVAASLVVSGVLPGCVKQQQSRPVAGGTGTPSDVIPYQLYARHLRVLASLNDGGKPLSTAEHAEIAAWLASLDFRNLGSPAKDDLEECRSTLTRFLTNPPKDAFIRGAQEVPLMKAFMAVFVDYEITGKTAKECGYIELAQPIDDLLKMAKGIAMVACEQNADDLKTARPPTRFYIEYFHLFNVLAGAKSRNVFVQAGLLSMEPGELQEPKDRTAIADLHAALLGLSRSRTTRDSNVEINTVRCLAKLKESLAMCAITDEELMKAGGETAAKAAQTIRSLGK